MSSWLLAGATALALTFSGAGFAQGQGKGQGGGQGSGKSEGGGKGRGQAAKAERAEPAPSQRVERGKDNFVQDRVAGPAKMRGPDRKAERIVNAGAGRTVKPSTVVDGPIVRRAGGSFACPPGLDRKDNGCLPPGQAKKLIGAPLAAAFTGAALPYAYRNWYRDDDQYIYRSGDGFIYRVDRTDGLVDGLIPLFGTGYYSLGDPWPQPYDFYNVPYQYRSVWSDGDDGYYRYSDGAIYRLDPTTSAVSAIVALLAGDLGVGSRLPPGYDTYNVPLAYRDRYADTADDWYRYNDGYIYRVDPTTRLITAVIDAIV